MLQMIYSRRINVAVMIAQTVEIDENGWKLKRFQVWRHFYLEKSSNEYYI